MPTAILDLAFVQGDVLARLNRNRQAEAAFRKEIAAFPGQRQTYANLALLMMVQGRVDVDGRRRQSRVIVIATTGLRQS